MLTVWSNKFTRQNFNLINKANSSDTEAPFVDLHSTISDGFVSSKIRDC